MLKLASKYRIGEIVDQENRTEQPSYMNATVVHGLSTRRCAEPGQRLDRSAATALNRRCDPNELVPDAFDEVQANVTVGHGHELRRHSVMPWHMQTAVAQMSESRTQVEAQRPGKPHCEIGVLMGVHGELRHVPRSALSNDA